MKKIFALAALLVLVISVSGCVEGEGGNIFSGLMGTGESKEAPNDILKITNKKIVPSPPIPAGDDFEFSFRVENLDSKKSAEETEVELYDTGSCDKDSEGIKYKNPEEIFPGATKIFKWDIKAPSNSDLGNMEGSCPLRYSVEYNFSAHTRSEAIVVSQERIEQASRSGESLTASPSETKSRGPIKIDVRFGSDQPLHNGSIIPFSVIVQNKGSGEVKDLKNKDVEISILGDEGTNIFNQWHAFNNTGEGKYCPPTGEGGGSSGGEESPTTKAIASPTGYITKGALNKDECVCYYPKHYNTGTFREIPGGHSWLTNKYRTKKASLPFLEGETPHIRCFYKFLMDEDDGPKKTYTVKVDINDYEYVLSDTKTVTVKPTYEP